MIPFDKDPDAAIIDYEHVACHECGHAVVALANGRTVTMIRLGRSVVMESHGETAHEPEADPENECLIASAGAVAEHLFWRGPALTSSFEMDGLRIRAIVRKSPGCFPGFVDRCDWFNCFIEQLQARAELILNRNSSAFHALLAELKKEIAKRKGCVGPFGLHRDKIQQVTAGLIS